MLGMKLGRCSVGNRYACGREAGGDPKKPCLKGNLAAKAEAALGLQKGDSSQVAGRHPRMGQCSGMTPGRAMDPRLRQRILAWPVFRMCLRLVRYPTVFGIPGH